MEYLSFWLIFDLHECKIEKQNVHYEKIFLIDWPRSFCEMTGIPYSFFFCFPKNKIFRQINDHLSPFKFFSIAKYKPHHRKEGIFFVVALLISREPWEKIQYPSFKLAYTPEHNFHQKDTYVSSWLQSIC